MANHRDEYARVLSQLRDLPDLPPIVTGLTASIDQLYRMDQRRVDALVAGQGLPRQAGELARTIVSRIRAGRGGEIVRLWDAGSAWLQRRLGASDLEQTGGNAAQASWSLAVLGAPTLLALRDRSPAQLDVLDPRILLAGADGVHAVSRATAAGTPLKQPHAILEFTAGTLIEGAPLPRSTRVMLRFSHEPLETDRFFLDHCRANAVNVALLSGLATQPSLASPDVDWAVGLAGDLHRRGAFVHHELSEFSRPADLRRAAGILPVASVGLSLSELTLAAGRTGSPAQLAAEFGATSKVEQLVVHADEWAMVVTTDPASSARDSLILANALASARAWSGRPSADPTPRPEAIFTDDLPESGSIGDGWHALVVPAPYHPRPRATVGLGDTFVAGLLLGEALSRPATSTRKATL